jgi:hypothetical protein
MSLLNTASPWKGCSTQKRTPSIGKRRTQRLPQPQQDDDAAELADLEEQDEISDHLKMTMTANDERSTAVNDMLNRITADPMDSGSGLADFKPVVKSRSFMDNLADLMPASKEGFESDLLRRASSSAVLPNDLSLDSLSNYTKSYEAGGILGKPYYAPKGTETEPNGAIMQKLNRITNILEDIQMEKTSNITEELILYSFLGVFVIFVVDSFARAGKYHR